MLMLAFADELTTFAEEQMQINKERAAIMHQAYTPNRRFINNRISQQLFNNRRLRTYLEDQKLCWDAGLSAIPAIYKQLIDSPFYIEYMAIESPTYEDDKQLWRKIYANLLMENEHLLAALEELEVTLDHQGWTTDIDLVLTYVVKTIKRFKEENGDEQILLEMFDSEQELNFAKDLLSTAIENADEFRALIASAVKNWESERIAYMDSIILIAALAEITQFNNIALEISMNEYIELAKEYSGDKSYGFINGVLNKIVQTLQQENKLFKTKR